MKLEIVFKDGRKATFDSVASFNVTEEQTANKECRMLEVCQTPTQGKFFEVNPLKIDRSKFEYEMPDKGMMELTRWIIQEAFAEVDKQPEKYASSFYTLIPEKKWNGWKTVTELKEYANDLGGMMADWVQQAMEWAQRISNGESWRSICNKGDTADYYRMIIWKDGCTRLIGGSRKSGDNSPASDVYSDYCGPIGRCLNTVPLVVIKKIALPTTIRF